MLVFSAIRVQKYKENPSNSSILLLKMLLYVLGNQRKRLKWTFAVAGNLFEVEVTQTGTNGKVIGCSCQMVAGR